MSVLDELARRGNTTAVVSEAGQFDYAELLGRVERYLARLAQQGVGAGAIVGVEIADEVEHLIASLALIAAGAHHITLATHDPPAVRSELAGRVGVTHVVGQGAEVTRRNAVFAAEGEGEGGVYLKTSGTTGGMNIIAFTAAQLAAQALRHPEYSTERLLRLASIEHNNSKRHRLYCMLMGGTNVFRPPGDFDEAAFCARHRVTCLDISRMHASNLAAQDRPGRFEGTKLRTGGSAIPIDVRRAVEQRVTPLLYVRYASTESGAIAMAGPGEHDEAESVGRPLPGVDLQIVGPDDQPLPRGETGRIRLRAPGVATGYLDGGEQTAERFRDGWFWPGDVGMLRADGSLIVQGRQDDMMVLNGLNIFPAEIERVLERHPDVSVAAALPLASRIHGQIPVAAVELKAKATTSAAQLQAYAREHLALRAPRRILVVEQLPRNSQGKIMRRAIAVLFEQRWQQ
ncbi:class I adenylate-forming enzyme family protein [Devosia sp. A16]|uniref:class I adenylate-forming enzyme family protein n=1 Tax=Devosia sp. A16 TaxID=1736675 RepID=UPI0006D7C783|nr:fatty acid--CoA ligase family protein [Devosia sp. A16]